jgi:hypothetical protein
LRIGIIFIVIIYPAVEAALLFIDAVLDPVFEYGKQLLLHFCFEK